MGLLGRFKEARAIRSIQAALQKQKPLEEAVMAARCLRDVGAERSVGILSEALGIGPAPLQIEAAHALSEVHKRCGGKRALEALNTAILHERQPAQVRQAAIEALVEIVDVRHAGSLIEVLKSNRSPLPVRSAALRGLKRLGYVEVLERLVESFLFGKTLDPDGEIRKWAVNELVALDDAEKLTKMFEVIHGRRRLRYQALNPEAGDPAALVRLMAQLDPRHALRLLGQMVDDTNPAVRRAAAQALSQIKDSDGARPGAGTP